MKLQDIQRLAEQHAHAEATGRVREARTALIAARRESLDAEKYWRACLKESRFDPQASTRAGASLTLAHTEQLSAQQELTARKQEMEAAETRLAEARARYEVIRKHAATQVREVAREVQAEQDIQLAERTSMTWWAR